MSSMLWCIVTFMIIIATVLYKRKREREKKRKIRSRANLPPGSMGWPYIGETLQMYSQDPNVFFAEKQKRYGEIFKTQILGCPSVMLTSPEAARFILVTHAHLFKPTYPKSKERLIGPSALFFHQGDYHLNLRKLIQNSLNLDTIRGLVADVDTLAANLTDSWDGGMIVNVFPELKKFSFQVGILAIFGNLQIHYQEELKKNYVTVDKGYNSFPTFLPGTSFQKAVQARKRLNEIVANIICERREKKIVENDMLGCLMNTKDDEREALRDDQIADNIIGALFAAQDTTASAMTWMIKYLHDNPKILEAVKAEQRAIRYMNDYNKQPLTWPQTRNMHVTYKVVLESLRMSSILSFLFREAVEDVEYKGYLIPKGWKVMPLFRSIHHNPEFFADPEKFDPSRFEETPKPYTFMPFGNGVHSCPGNELAKLEMLMIAHHLASRFRWEVSGSQSGVQYSPFPVPIHGLPARFWKESAV